MNYIKRISKHYSTKFMNERTTTDSLEANLFFECEPKESCVKLTEEFDLPTIRKCDDDSDSDESCHNVEFASITSFLSQNLSLAFTNKLQFCAGLSVLISMIVSCSLIGPLTIALPSKSPFIQILWRYFGSTLISILMMIVLYTFKGAEVVTFSNFTLLKLLKCCINSLLIFVWNLGFVLGCTMTIVSHANLCNSSGIFILLFAVFIVVDDSILNIKLS